MSWTFKGLFADLVTGSKPGTSDASTAAGNAADAANQALNQQLVNNGTWNGSQQQIAQQDYATNASGDVGDAAASGFQEGLAQGVQNEKNFVNNTFFGVLKSIPVSVWIVLAVVGFVWLGGLVWLKGAFAKK